MIADVGLVGPWSLAEQTQNKFHEVVGFDYTNGWQHQIGNRLLLMGSLGYTRKIVNITAGKVLDFDILLHSGAGIGNWLIYGNIGSEVRFGYNLEEANPFGSLSTRLERGMINSAAFNHENVKYPKDFLESFYMFVGAQAHGIVYDVTIDSNGHDINRELFVGNFVGGIAAVLNIGNFGPISIVASTTFRTERFKEQKGPHYFSSLNIQIPLGRPAKTVNPVQCKRLPSTLGNACPEVFIGKNKALKDSIFQQIPIEHSI